MNSEAGGGQDLPLLFSLQQSWVGGRRSPQAQHLRDVGNLSTQAK